MSTPLPGEFVPGEATPGPDVIGGESYTVPVPGEFMPGPTPPGATFTSPSTPGGGIRIRMTRRTSARTVGI